MNTQYLYHYTNLESLILILKNKTIRLNPLSKLDDLDESTFENFQSAANYTFISSWTSEINESVSFWNMYTREMHGVRIKLPKNPFKKYEYKCPVEFLHINSNFEFYLPYEKINGDNYFILPFNGNMFSYPVKYTNDERKLYSKLIEETGENTMSFSLGNVGLYKRMAWDFQKEWRYRISVIPGHVQIMRENGGYNLLKERMRTNYKIPIEYIDLEIIPECMEHMEILTGPKMTVGEKEILKIIVEKYLPSSQIVESQLRIR